MEKLIKVTPTFNRLLTTMNVYDEDQIENGIISKSKTKGSLKPYQTVLAVGDTVRNIKVGDIVCINPTRYSVMKHENGSMKNGVIQDNMVVGYKFNTLIINDIECLMLYDQDIDFIVNEMEEVPDNKVEIIQPVIQKV